MLRTSPIPALLLCALTACGDSARPLATSPTLAFAPRPPVDPAAPTEIRTIPDPACITDYLGTSGQLESVTDPGLGLPSTIDGGSPAPAEVAATLPNLVYLRGNTETYSDADYFAMRNGIIYVKANHELTNIDEPWRNVQMPGCLNGKVTEISADGGNLLALDPDRWIYTLNTGVIGPAGTGWTRRWGPFFWTDPGAQLPADVTAWATSALDKDVDHTFTDGGGREQAVFGISTLYALRGDGLRITYLDPWLPSDQSREVCGPERGTVALAGLSGSGSTVMVIGKGGEIFTRLYEFDISGANTVFFDYSWQDQDQVAQPLVQLPPPEWIRHPAVPGRVTNRVSIRKVPPGTKHRIMRVEGLDDAGHSGYWEKDLAEQDATAWRFTRTDEPLRGALLPLPGPYRYVPEDSRYAGKIAGWDAEVLNFNPYCSPATLRIHIGSGAPTDFILHTTDGLRQERRARGLDAQPHVYRSAVEVPKVIWNALDQQPTEVRDFISAHFSQRFLTGPLTATPATLKITQPCWTLQGPSGAIDPLIPPGYPDAAILVAELLAAQEENRTPNLCP